MQSNAKLSRPTAQHSRQLLTAPTTLYSNLDPQDYDAPGSSSTTTTTTTINLSVSTTTTTLKDGEAKGDSQRRRLQDSAVKDAVKGSKKGSGKGSSEPSGRSARSGRSTASNSKPAVAPSILTTNFETREIPRAAEPQLSQAMDAIEGLLSKLQ